MSDVDWTSQLAEQLDWHWRSQCRPRLDGKMLHHGAEIALLRDLYRWQYGRAAAPS